MTTVARHVRFTARAGQGGSLADALLAAAAGMSSTPGCLRWIVSRGAQEPDVVVVEELWRDADHLAAAEDGLQEDESVREVLALLDPATPPQRIDLEPLGGVGHLPAAPDGVTLLHLHDAEDKAPRFGMAEVGAARFPTAELGLGQTGVALHSMKPGRRHPFGHQHGEAEELYVVLAGSGRAKLDDEVVELGERDALRVGPRVTRAFEGGPEGLELLVVGPRREGDGEVLPGWWS
jgi:quinol monooxygenase YgiN/quercetin dioxygenase-like cupin family protein